MNTVKHVNQLNFKSEVLEAKEVVLLDFFASWCGPCQMLGPVLEELARENEDIKVCKVNTDENPELAQAFKVMSIPALYVLKDGKIIKQSVGFQPKQALVKMVRG